MLLIVAFCTSYTMQQRKITAIHETVVSIFGGALLPPFACPLPARCTPHLTPAIVYRHDRWVDSACLGFRFDS